MSEMEKTLLRKLGDRVREIRITELLLTQEEMGANCGLTQNQISLIESGLVDTRLFTLYKICLCSHHTLSSLLNI
jgi:predicted transcriptional regulator